MRISRFVCVLAGFAAAAPLLSAQDAAVAVSTIAGIQAGGGESAQAKLPYTATWTQTSVQTLADGNTITRQITTKFARDSSGRTYTETHNMLPVGQDGQQHEIVLYHIFDPVARTSLSWNSNTKEANLFHQPAPGAATSVRLPTMPLQADAPQTAKPNPDFQHEDLGTKNVAGINAKGVRYTHIIPAGQVGNDQPITVVNEIWRSTEYGLVVQSINDDPRTGKTTREVTDFEPGDPDPSLFRAPDGYSVHEITPRPLPPLAAAQ